MVILNKDATRVLQHKRSSQTKGIGEEKDMLGSVQFVSFASGGSRHSLISSAPGTDLRAPILDKVPFSGLQKHGETEEQRN